MIWISLRSSCFWTTCFGFFCFVAFFTGLRGVCFAFVVFLVFFILEFFLVFLFFFFDIVLLTLYVFLFVWRLAMAGLNGVNENERISNDMQINFNIFFILIPPYMLCIIQQN